MLSGHSFGGGVCTAGGPGARTQRQNEGDGGGSVDDGEAGWGQIRPDAGKQGNMQEV